MFTSLLRFIWIAFREYWGVWVTGTGIIGLALWGLSFTQNVTGWKMKSRHYIVVLFCVFWFLATFSAWHDADKNLTIVTNQRAEDVGNLKECQGSLKAESALRGQTETQLTSQQSTINSLQTAFNGQQGAVNSCVVSLGKMNPIINTRIVVIPYLVGTSAAPNGDSSFFEIVITVSRPSTATGTLVCEKAFRPVGNPLVPMIGQPAFESRPPNAVSDHEYRITVDKELGEWGPNSPIFLAASSRFSDLGRCSFTPQQ